MRQALFLLLGGVTMASDNGKHHFFTPKPADQMRELSTDRPDQTESPYTVDAGHLQLEMDLVNWTHDREGGTELNAWNVAPLNLKLGLLENADLQIVIENWSREELKSPGGKSVREGFGDLTLRWKQNLWGNNGGATVLAVMPFVTIPLDASDLSRPEPEAGIIIPFGWNLPHGFYLGMMTEWDWLNDEKGGHRNAWFNTITLGAELTDRVGAYVEFTATAYDDETPWEGTVDGGFTFAVNDNVQLDIGCNVGVTKSAPDVQPFIGLTYRY